MISPISIPIRVFRPVIAAPRQRSATMSSDWTCALLFATSDRCHCRPAGAEKLSCLKSQIELSQLSRWVAHYSGPQQGYALAAIAMTHRVLVTLALQTICFGALSRIDGAPSIIAERWRTDMTPALWAEGCGRYPVLSPTAQRTLSADLLKETLSCWKHCSS